jgi:hypothetical protein
MTHLFTNLWKKTLGILLTALALTLPAGAARPSESPAVVAPYAEAGFHFENDPARPGRLQVVPPAVPFGKTSARVPDGVILSLKTDNPASLLADETSSRRSRDYLHFAEADELFRHLAANEKIAFRFPQDGCYARAYLMTKEIADSGIWCGKIWAFGSLYARTENVPDKAVTWGYHVAPVVLVERAAPTSPTGVEYHYFVIDPSMFTGPVTMETWLGAMRPNKTDRLPAWCITRLGVAPVKDGRQCPGHGYWPSSEYSWGKDVQGNMEYDAIECMKAYKPWEGKRAPDYVFNWRNTHRPGRHVGTKLAKMEPPFATIRRAA